MSPRPKAVPLTEAPPIEPGRTYALDGTTALLVREIVYQGPISAAVYLAQRFEVDEIQYVVTEPTKKRPEGRAFWKRIPRQGARAQ